MRFPQIPRRWRLRTLMIVVGVTAVAMFAYREYAERGPVYWQLWRLRTGGAATRSDAAFSLGLLGPRASFAIRVLTTALDDPDPDVRAQAMYTLVRLGSRSPRLLPILLAEIERTPEPLPGMHFELTLFDSFGNAPGGWPLSDGGLPMNHPVEALKRIQPDTALVVPGLRKLLAAEADHVRRAALDALFAVATWSTPPSPELAEALLAVLAENRFHLPEQGMGSENFNYFYDRKRVVDALARLDRATQERAIAMLAADLRDLGTPRSYEAALLLPRFADGTAVAVSTLCNHFRDGDEVRRSIALVLLHQLGEPAAPAAQAILRVIDEPDTDREVDVRRQMSWWETLSANEARNPSARPFVNPLATGRSSVVSLSVRTLEAMGKPVEGRAIHELLAIVGDSNRTDDRKRGAIRALGEFGPEAAVGVQVLVSLIRSREAAYRQTAPDAEREQDGLDALAAQALGKIAEDGDPQVVAILADLLEARNPRVSNNAVHALFLVGPKARPAIPALVKALKSPYQSLRFTASAALARLGGPEVLAVLPALVAALDDEDRWVRTHAVEAIGKLGPEAKAAVPRMVRVLWEFGPGFEVARSLGRIGPDASPAVPALLFYHDVAREADPPEIREAIDRIVPRASGSTIAGSIAALKASDPASRFRAAYELGRLLEETPPTAEAVTALAGAVEDRDPLVRQMAASMLCRLGPAVVPAGPALVRAARDPDESVRRLVTVALGRSAAVVPAAVPTLTDMMKDESGDVRRWAAGALAWVGPPAGSAVPGMLAGLEGQDIPTRISILAALGRFALSHEAVRTTLLKALDDPSEEIRKAAVNALGEHVNTRRDVVLPALLKAMNDPSWDVRLQVSWRLGMIRPVGDILPTLLERLAKGEPHTRHAAAGALGELCEAEDRDPKVTRRAVDALAAALGDHETEVRSVAAWRLACLGAVAEPAESALRAVKDDPNSNVRANASTALRNIAEGRAHQ